VPLRKNADEPGPCTAPGHEPPSLISLPPGTYEHECPACDSTVATLVPPVLVTRESLAATAAERFRSAYQRDGHWPLDASHGPYLRGRRYEDIYADLARARTVEEVERVLPRELGWTRVACDNCDQDVEAAVQVGSHSDEEYGPCHYCRPCLELALGAFS
jgi:hypothetical protein